MKGLKNMQIKQQFSDKLSICLSICCILHCITLPLVIIILPSVASFWISNENVHVILVILAIPISLFAMGKSLRKHHNYRCIALAILGLFLLVVAIFMHDIGLNGEHGQNVYGREEKNNHAHDEHGGLGETLETIFTIIGGLILLSSHFLNIRFAKQSN